MTSSPDLPNDPLVGQNGNRTLRCRLVETGVAGRQTFLGANPPLNLAESLRLSESTATASSTLLLATLGHCLVDRIRAHALIGNVVLGDLTLEIEADLAISPLLTGPGRAPDSVGFEAVQVKVHMAGDAPEFALQALLSHAVMWSPVANTLNSPVRLNVELAPLTAA